MNREQISVFVNCRPVKIYRGMTVKHALLALDQTLLKAAQEGEIRVRDDQGFIVGLEGTLHDQARLYSEKVQGKRERTRKEGREIALDISHSNVKMNNRNDITKINRETEVCDETQRKKSSERKG
jgi:hypothetical protein